MKVIIEQAARAGPCPACGVFSGTVKDRPVHAGLGAYRPGAVRKRPLDGITWRRSDPWLTRIVDCSADGPDRCWGWPLAGLQIVAWHDEDASRQQVDADLDTLMDKLCEAFRAGN